MTNAPSISIKRHYRKLSEKETDELVGAVADLIVARVKERGSGRTAPVEEIDNSGEAGRPGND